MHARKRHLMVMPVMLKFGGDLPTCPILKGIHPKRDHRSEGIHPKHCAYDRQPCLSDRV